MLNIEPVSKIVSEIHLRSKSMGYWCQKLEIEGYKDDRNPMNGAEEAKHQQ
jgi:hypothetical protein